MEIFYNYRIKDGKLEYIFPREDLFNMEDFFKQVEKYCEEIKKKLKCPDLRYISQISISTENSKPSYAIQIHNIADGLVSTLIDEDPSKLIAKLSVLADDFNPDEIEIAYHKSQKKSAEITAAYHEKQIKEIEKMIKNRKKSKKGKK